jgi:hypothetical protein
VVIGRLPGRGDWTLRRDGEVLASGADATVHSSADAAVRAGDGGVELRCPAGPARDYTLAVTR